VTLPADHEGRMARALLALEGVSHSLAAAFARRYGEGPRRGCGGGAHGILGDVAVAADKLGTGRMVIASDTVPFCVWIAARNLGRFENALWEAVSGLGDRGTTCAIVGRILPGNVGSESLPAEWLARREPLSDPVSGPLPGRQRP